MSNLDPAWRALGVTPIPGADSPFGLDPKEEMLFEAIEAEIDKLQTDPVAVDWDEIVTAAVDLLGTRSKDWRVACWLAVALYQCNGYAGLAVGLAILRDLIDESRWEKIHPPARRTKMRGAFLDWLAERLTLMFDKDTDEATAEDTDALASAVESLGEIDARLSVALGDHAPILNRLIAGLDARYASAKSRSDARAAAEDAAQNSNQAPNQNQIQPGDQTAAPGTAGAPAEANAATNGTPAPSSEQLTQVPATAAAKSPEVPIAQPEKAPISVPKVDTGGGSVKALRELKNAMLTIAASLRQAESSDPRSYVLLRSAIWMDVVQLPPNVGGVTGIPEPSAEKRKQCAQLQQQGEWLRLIEDMEKTLASGQIFWLDAHRFVAIALEELGAGYRDARRGVLASLALLLRRFPGIERLKFAQGAGFCDELTMSWIESEVNPMAAGADGGASVGGEQQGQPWAVAAREAEALSVKGKVKEGLTLFRDGIRAAGSLRERFCWELAQARICADAGYRDAALMQTRHLAQIADQFQLDDWEPALVLELARLYVVLHNPPDSSSKIIATEGETALYQRMITRLYRFDVAAAVDAIVS